MTLTQKEKVQLFGALVARTLLKLFWIFPIKNNRVALLSYSGTQYSCNPKYISMKLEARYPGRFDRVFALRDPNKWSGNGERFVKFLSLRNLYDFCTAKVLVCNCGMPTYLPKRKGQFVINTWHGGGAYKINKYGGNFEQRGVSKQRRQLDLYKTKCTDLVLSSCQLYSKAVVPELVFQYQGEIMACGSPRNDILYNEHHERLRENICRTFNIDPANQIILYAPTYRGSIDGVTVQAVKEFSMALDGARLNKAISARFYKQATLLIRAHHAMNMAEYQNAQNVVDVSAYPDTQEILCAADILISDYSSIIWDFSLTKKPCFLFCPDLDYYLNEDRGVYTPIETWPGILCRSNEELEQAILNFDEAEYIKKVEQHHADLGSYETGTACKQVCDRIYEVCFGAKPKEEHTAE